MRGGAALKRTGRHAAGARAWWRAPWAVVAGAIAALACLRCSGSASNGNGTDTGGKSTSSGGGLGTNGGVSAGGGVNAGASGSSVPQGARSGSGAGGAAGETVGGAGGATAGSAGSAGTGGAPGSAGSAGMAGHTAAGGSSGNPGAGGRAGNAGASGSLSGGGSMSGGSAGKAGTGGSAGSQGGTAGANSIEYRACEPGGSITRITVYRIDVAAQTCTELVIQQGAGGCTLGLMSGGFCLSRANVSHDVAACQMLKSATGAVDASSATGTFSVSPGASIAVDLDVTLQFPSSASLPTTVHTQAADCAADCMLNDCRP